MKRQSEVIDLSSETDPDATESETDSEAAESKKSPKKARLQEEEMDSESESEAPSSQRVKMSLKSANFVKRMTLEATGAMPGAWLRGCSKRTNGVVLYCTGLVRPYKRVHDQIRQRGEWVEFYRKCRLRPGFTHFSEQEMEKWLVDNARPGSIASLGSDNPQDRLVVKTPGKEPSQFLKMGDNVCNPDGFTSADMEALLPRPAKTKKHKKHSLVLHRSGYELMDATINVLAVFDPRTTSLVLDLENRTEDTQPTAGKKFIKISDTVGTCYESAPKSNFAPSPDLKRLGALIFRMDNGELKSLLQKLLRFAPLAVKMDDENFPTPLVLQAVCERCLIHPGGKRPFFGV
jgi:hypothetical protein